MHAVLEARRRHLVVAVGRHGDDGRIGFPRKNLPEIREGGASMLLRELRSARAVRVHHARELDARKAGELVRVIAPHVAGADDDRLQ
ncbi:hypothetical protein D3C83_61620 [compost metagenome]